MYNEKVFREVDELSRTLDCLSREVGRMAYRISGKRAPESAEAAPSASPNSARDEIAAAVTDLVAYLDGGASVRPDDDWHKRLRQLSPVA